MSNLRDKINSKMDDLQSAMESNTHLKDPDNIELQITNLSKFWSVLSEEDRDYIHGARHALEEQQEWKV